MRFFHQLTDEEREKAVEYCTGMVLEDIADGSLELEPFTGEDLEAKKVIDHAVKQINGLETHGEKIDALIANPKVMDIAFNIATEMYKSFVYLEPMDNVMFAEDYMPDYECPHCKAEKETQEQDVDPIIDHKTKHKKHSIN
jgi:hypothetical protein